MIDKSIYSSELDHQRHHQAICALANEFTLAEMDVATLYEEELRDLCTHARIRQYLLLLTARHVKEILRHIVTDQSDLLVPAISSV